MTLQQLLALPGNKAKVHKITGLSRTTLYKIQIGASVPKSTTYAEICRALGKDPWEIYASEDYVKEE